MLRACLAGVVVAVAIVSTGCNFVFGIELGIAGGAAESCPPEKPAQCDTEYLADPKSCCVEGRSCGGGACIEGVCYAETFVEGVSGEEGLGIVVAGGYVVWSTGGSHSIHRKKLDGSGPVDDLVGPEQTDFGYITMLAADDDPVNPTVFFTDYGGPRIGRASVKTGQPEVLARVPEAQAPGAQALLGRILVHGEYVYWALDYQGGTTSHIWRAPKGKQGDATVDAELAVTNAGAYGLAGDDEHLYFGNAISSEVLRLRWADIGNAEIKPVALAKAQGPVGDVAVDAENVYWVVNDQVRYQKKDVPNGVVTAVPPVDSNIFSVLSDGRDLYFSSLGDSNKLLGALWRVPLGGGAEVEELDQAEVLLPNNNAGMMSSLAHDCERIYFLTFEAGEVRRLTK